MLKPSGRFAHDPAHVEKIYGARFRAVASQSTTLRFEANQPVAGQLLLFATHVTLALGWTPDTRNKRRRDEYGAAASSSI
jgi:hypothetical protein